ncbi:helix-turn-helix transcriptional regulator [Geobacter sp. DSM 9736]|uniref:helix-turn-helix transcriptional regulator n=1 Tax=Geobacter sp. DSM 9736 TaxID=1277350 RepID=UPI000B513FA9|nr:helix-turn-helix domain-containing protein [Geobacter sp. DSM 9736]SNB44778.1 DNA-binding transcriptional regulator, XRE-family HTH domain [Geobacter sp. DSM 9736]
MRLRIGTRLKQLRTDRGMTQKELASRISGGIDYTYIGKIEREEQLPSLKILLKISEALQVPVGSFFADAAVPFPMDMRLQRLNRTKTGKSLLNALQQVEDEDLPLLVEIVEVLARHRRHASRAHAALRAAEEQPPYGDPEDTAG